MNDIAITVHNVSKCYHVYESQRARLRHAFMPSNNKGVSEVWALKDISFEVKRGESVAIIGRNGSGKSTLLEIITGTLTPTTGHVEVKGRVAALLELGSGFNPEYTGRENVFLNGLLLGLTRAEVERRFDDIASFADIGEVLDRPVKTYSSGMLMRLAFAVQVALEPDILIVDEALSVGDFFFQQKCMARIRELQEKGTTILFVSHDMQVVRDLCQKGLFLQAGHTKFWGDNLTAINHYLTEEGRPVGYASSSQSEVIENQSTVLLNEAFWTNLSGETKPDKKALLLAIGVYDSSGKPTLIAEIGTSLVFRILFQAFCQEAVHVTLVIRNRYNQVVTSVGSYTLDTMTPLLSYGQQAVFELKTCLMIESGLYTFTVSLAHPSDCGKTGVTLDESPPLGPLEVTWDYQARKPKFFGMFGLDVESRFIRQVVE